jgi:dethiobiotin synthetase
MKRVTFFITGTDTGVGKTVLTALLAQFLRKRGVNAAALKPICSGSRGDARTLHAAMSGALTLDEINPWYFRAPIAPLLAARRENKRVKLSQVLAHVRAMHKRFDTLLIEGAGGLLSPLGGNFNSRDLIAALHATPVVVCPNRLGAVNQVLLALEALPKNLRVKTRVVLMSPLKPDVSANTNGKLLAEFAGAEKNFQLPWLGGNFVAAPVFKNLRVRRTLEALISAF